MRSVSVAVRAQTSARPSAECSAVRWKPAAPSTWTAFSARREASAARWAPLSAASSEPTATSARPSVPHWRRLWRPVAGSISTPLWTPTSDSAPQPAWAAPWKARST
ncbi:hypothetical protein OPAG_08579, partial [Rhodococcus opacus PD630]